MADRREIDPAAISGLYSLLGTLVTPRPIAWVSTLSADHADNLAPHSFFQIVSTSPPIVMISSMGEKDTVRNIRATGEFVVCGSPASMIKEINLTSVEFPHGVSEFDRVGLTREPSVRVAPPRVADSPYALECRCIDIRHVGHGILVLGEVIHIAVSEDVFVGASVDVTRVDPVARLGGSQWSALGAIVEVPRVTLEEFETLNPP
jgi:flavin reductase (DIM6/NTAB) family NADH-FMN oxidoreductase RutF